jgi:2'-5' RNA ligase
VPGVISLLDDTASQSLLGARAALEDRFGFRDDVIGQPHLTYHLADSYDLPRAEAALEGLAKASPPVRLRARGLELFRNPHSTVVYLAVEPNPALARLQAKVAAALSGASQGVGAHFAPGRWTPHLSLAVLPGDGWPLEEMLDFAANRLGTLEARVESLTLMRDRAGRGDWVNYKLAAPRGRAAYRKDPTGR